MLSAFTVLGLAVLMAFTVRGARDVLAAYFGGQSVYAALDRQGTELTTASNYARVEVPSSAWDFTQDSGNNRGQAATNAAIIFPTADAAYVSDQIPTHMSLYDLATGGNQIVRDAISITAVATGERVRVPSGDGVLRLTIS